MKPSFGPRYLKLFRGKSRDIKDAGGFTIGEDSMVFTAIGRQITRKNEGQLTSTLRVSRDGQNM